MVLTGVGHGKLILFGEHAAVHGFPALGVSLRCATRVTLHLDTGHAWRLSALTPEDARDLRRVLGLLAPGGGGEVKIRSDVPRGVGFGSSAALCVALAGALARARPPYGRSVWEKAHEAETLFHGRPSGVDTGLSLLGGCRSFRPSPPGLPSERALPSARLALVVGAVPRRSSTGGLVAAISARLAKHDPEATLAIRVLGDIAREAEAAFLDRSASPRSLGGLADRAHSALRALDLSTPALEGLLQAGKEMGCAGGKLSGAGGGGAFYLVCTSPAHARSVARRLARLGDSEGVMAQAVTLP